MPPVTLPDCATEAERADFARGLAILDGLLAGMRADHGAAQTRLAACLVRIAAHEDRLSAFTLVMADAARAEAARLDALPDCPANLPF